jgi:hypothetical protein
MKKQYINPVCKVMTLSLKNDVLNDKFGNQSYIPVGNVEGGYEDDAVGNMYSSQSSVWDE